MATAWQPSRKDALSQKVRDPVPVCIQAGELLPQGIYTENLPNLDYFLGFVILFDGSGGFAAANMAFATCSGR